MGVGCLLRCYDNTERSRKGMADRRPAANTTCGYSGGCHALLQCTPRVQAFAERTMGAPLHSRPRSWASLTRPQSLGRRNLTLLGWALTLTHPYPSLSCQVILEGSLKKRKRCQMNSEFQSEHKHSRGLSVHLLCFAYRIMDSLKVPARLRLALGRSQEVGSKTELTKVGDY